jgi:hypothetical protein
LRLKQAEIKLEATAIFTLFCQLSIIKVAFEPDLRRNILKGELLKWQPILKR